MIDISDIVGKPETFLLVTQNHGWTNDKFTDPKANPDLTNRTEGSVLYVVNGLKR
jgi:hypothetical protein